MDPSHAQFVHHGTLTFDQSETTEMKVRYEIMRMILTSTGTDMHVLVTCWVIVPPHMHQTRTGRN